MFKEIELCNLNFLNQIEGAIEVIKDTSVPSELSGFYNHLMGAFQGFKSNAEQCIDFVKMGNDLILPELIVCTQNLSNFLSFYQTRYLPTLLNFTDRDMLVLKVIDWLHKSNNLTENHSFTVSHEDFKIYPHPSIPAIYYLPAIQSNKLLYLPLLFHEIGHLYYSLKEDELDPLVSDFQDYVEKEIMPRIARNLQNDKLIELARRRIIQNWYYWTQEIYCDVVGLAIGGKSFLKAYQLFFLLESKRSFYLKRDEILQSTHPVSWIRTKILSAFSEKYGFKEESKLFNATWSECARIQNIEENYHGTWKDAYIPSLVEIIEYMIEETNPYKCSDFDLSINEISEISTPIQLLNLSWKKFEESPDEYMTWEVKAITHYTNT